MPYFTQSEANELVGLIANIDVELPPALARYEEIKQAMAEASSSPPAANVLDLTADELMAYAEKLALYRAPTTLPALGGVVDQAASAAREALKSGEIDATIISLRPAFDAAAKKLNKAARMGITSATTAEQILRFPDPDAIETFKGLPRVIAAISRIAQFRIRVSELLDVSPTAHEQSLLRGYNYGYDITDFSGAFTADDSFSISGAHNVNGQLHHFSKSASIDWLALGRLDLYLTTPAEAAIKYERALTQKVQEAH